MLFSDDLSNTYSELIRQKLEEVSYKTVIRPYEKKHTPPILMLKVCPFEITHHVVMTIHLDHPKIATNWTSMLFINMECLLIRIREKIM